MRRTSEIQISSHPEKSDGYVARYSSGFFDAAYTVEFPNSIIGAVALCHFVEMILFIAIIT